MPTSDTMPMAGANGGTHSRRISRQQDWHLPPPPPPPPERPRTHTFTPNDRVTLSAVGAILALLLTLAWQAWEIRRDIRDIRYGTWTIEDQREFQRLAGQGGLMLPDTVEVIRRRLPNPVTP